VVGGGLVDGGGVEWEVVAEPGDVGAWVGVGRVAGEEGAGAGGDGGVGEEVGVGGGRVQDGDVDVGR